MKSLDPNLSSYFTTKRPYYYETFVTSLWVINCQLYSCEHWITTREVPVQLMALQTNILGQRY